MSQFIETLRIVDGEIKHLSYHQRRLCSTLTHFYPSAPVVDLQEVLSRRPLDQGLFKARVVYGENGVVEVSYAPYAVRTIRSLQLFEENTIDYCYKSTDRRCLEALVARKGTADELIIVKNGWLTDTSYSNIALFDGKEWYTPRLPLLKGTMRQYLLDQGQIQEADIRPEDLKNYQQLALINAMMPLGACVVRLQK